MQPLTMETLKEWKAKREYCPICGLRHPKKKRPLDVDSCGMCRFEMVGDDFHLFDIEKGEWVKATDEKALDYINKGIAFNQEAFYRVEKDVGFEDGSDVVKYDHVGDFEDFGSVQAFIEAKKVSEQQQLYVTLHFSEDEWDDDTFYVRADELIDITYWWE